MHKLDPYEIEVAQQFICFTFDSGHCLLLNISTTEGRLTSIRLSDMQDMIITIKGTYPGLKSLKNR